MSSRVIQAGALAALLIAGAARAEDTQPAHARDQDRDAVRAAMHDAMQRQMAAPAGSAHMPGMMERAKDDATAAQEHAAHVKQDRDAARQRAMQHGTQDAAAARGDGHGGMQTGSGHAGGMMNGDTTQQGAGMMRTGTMHGGSDGMMPGGPGRMMPGGGMGSTGTGATSDTATGTSGSGMSH
jgi:hypothetical protein